MSDRLYVRFMFASALALAAGLAMSPNSVARCEQPALITTLSPSSYSYLYTPGVIPSEEIGSLSPASVGAFWALGFGDPEVGIGIDNGSFPANDGWFYRYPGYPTAILTTWAADNRIDGCIDSATTDPDCTAILVSDGNDDGDTFFTFLAAAETPTRDFEFGLPGNAPIVLAPIPQVEVLAYDGTLAAVASPTLPPEGFHLDPLCVIDPEDVVRGYKVYLYRQTRDGSAPTERKPATDPSAVHAWQPAVGGVRPDGGPIPYGSTALVEVGCQGWDIYLALQLVFDSGYETGFLSLPGDAFPACGCNGLDEDDDGFCENDCDDSDPDVFPGAPQTCDGRNNDCGDPNWPDVDATELDLDGDGYFQCQECDDADPTTYPDAPQLCGDEKNNDCRDPDWPSLDSTNERDLDDDGITECGGDCSPRDDTVYPGAPEICDGLSNDCNAPGWPAPPANEVDSDGDSHPACDDCDDAAATVFPGAPEICDGLSNECNDPAWPELEPREQDNDSDGFRACEECDDTIGTVYPGAPEICDGRNNDCNDPQWPTPINEDIDNDGDGSPACGGDCNDNASHVFPGAPQICDRVNNDCNDPNWPVLPADERDGDGDGAPFCADCDDTDPRVLPAGPQLCDGINNDCQHPNFPSLEGTNEFDDDEDGFSECAGDCDDWDPFRSPGLVEDCDNGIDDDCDNLADYFDAADCRDLLVVLDTFTATTERGGVRLRWTTRREIDSAGFRVLRSNGGRRIEAISPRILPRGDSLGGASYEFFDAERQSTDHLRYWLEEIDTRGIVTTFGPITVDLPAPASGRNDHR